MNRKAKYFMPFMALLTLVSCNDKVTTSHHTSNTSTPSPTSVITPSSDTSSTTTIEDVGAVNLVLDLSNVVASTKRPDLGENWTSDFTYTYDKAIVLKKTTDFILTPPFKTKKSIEVIITGFLEKGNLSDDKLVVSASGVTKEGKVIEEDTLTAKDIKGTKEAPLDIKFTLSNTSGNIEAIKIGLKETGRASNFGINKLVVTSK